MKHFCCTRVGIENPTIEVRFDHLNVEAETYVGSRALPSFINFVADFVEVYKSFHFQNFDLRSKSVSL